VIPKRVNCHSTHLSILSDGIVPTNHCLHFVAQSLIERSLASDRGTSGSFCSATSFKNLASALRSQAARFALIQRAM
jgi:hypothetical protein